MQLSRQPVLIGTSGAIAVVIEGHRLHLQHGPIDLIIKCDGDPPAVERAYLRAAARFETILPELVGELCELRQAIDPGYRFRGTTAQRMHTAVKCLSPDFVTPMAAVAGAVADEILASLRAQPQGLARVFVNNGGDIALWNGSAVPFNLGVVAGAQDRAMPEWPAEVEIAPDSNIGGIATSGWRGRSHSLGIADAVTVLAADAATADAAATVIANAVNLQSAKILRRPACAIDADSRSRQPGGHGRRYGTRWTRMQYGAFATVSRVHARCSTAAQSRACLHACRDGRWCCQRPSPRRPSVSLIRHLDRVRLLQLLELLGNLEPVDLRSIDAALKLRALLL